MNSSVYIIVISFIEDMEVRVNSAISDIEVLTKGFNYLEVEW